MKKILFLATCAVLALSASSCGSKDVHTTDVTTLPATAIAVVTNHFGDATVSDIKVDRDNGTVEYDVTLSNGTKIEFDSTGTITEAKAGRGTVLPTAIIPDAIINYVNENYAGQSIVGYDRERAGYEVKLVNGLELKFDAQGSFVRIDH